MPENNVLLGVGLIIFGAVIVAICGAGWAGWLRHEVMRSRPGFAQQIFAWAFLGGPAAILLGVFELRALSHERLTLQALDVALAGAFLILAGGATVIYKWKPVWLEPSWVRRERSAWQLQQLNTLKHQYGIGDSSPTVERVKEDDWTGQYGLSGYETQRNYDAREPTWTQDPFHSEPEALLAANDWLAAQGAEAQVEVLHYLSNREAEVVAVVTQSGVERIEGARPPT